MRSGRDRRPARRKPHLSPKPRILVLCEGERSEPEYLRGFRLAFRNPLVDLEIAKERGVPATLVREAKRLKKEADDEAKRKRDENLRYDQVWIAFDVDEHPKVAEAVDKARSNGIHVALSNPCFELWLLLHSRESPGMQNRHEVQRMVGKIDGDRGKGVDFNRYKDRYGVALERARRLHTEAESMGEAGRNPTTWFYLLTEEIRGS